MFRCQCTTIVLFFFYFEQKYVILITYTMVLIQFLRSIPYMHIIVFVFIFVSIGCSCSQSTISPASIFFKFHEMIGQVMHHLVFFFYQSWILFLHLLNVCFLIIVYLKFELGSISLLPVFCQFMCLLRNDVFQSKTHISSPIKFDNLLLTSSKRRQYHCKSMMHRCKIKQVHA